MKNQIIEIAFTEQHIRNVYNVNLSFMKYYTLCKYKFSIPELYLKVVLGIVMTTANDFDFKEFEIDRNWNYASELDFFVYVV